MCATKARNCFSDICKPDLHLLFMNDLIAKIVRRLMSVEKGKGHIFPVEKICWEDPVA